MNLSAILRPSRVLEKARRGAVASCMKSVLADPRVVEFNPARKRAPR
jgi:hypothetical protein